MFIGTTFLCGRNTLLPPATNVTNFTSLSISKGVYDHLYLSENPTETVDDINGEWTSDTRLNAKFEENFEGGNVNFHLKNTDTLVIKTREKGTLEWKTIYTIEVDDNDDFNFIKAYPYSRNLSNNEYMLVNQINGIENSYIKVECRTEFEGYFVVDKENVYGTIFNINVTDTVQNINNTTLELLNNKYPTVYTNSDSNYTTGTTSGCFLKVDLQRHVADIEEGVRYRAEVMQWICNGKPKILKLEDGRIYMIKVTGQPTDTNEGHRDLRRLSFDWAEIGDVNSEKDLYMNNLSDVTAEYW